MNKLSISISSEISNIVKVENFVETFTDYFALPSVLYGKISLSVIEAVNNAILSGNKRQPDKMVSLVAEKTDKQFKVTVSDEGEGFDYEVIPDPTLPDNINKITGRPSAGQRPAAVHRRCHPAQCAGTGRRLGTV